MTGELVSGSGIVALQLIEKREVEPVEHEALCQNLALLASFLRGLGKVGALRLPFICPTGAQEAD